MKSAKLDAQNQPRNTYRVLLACITLAAVVFGLYMEFDGGLLTQVFADTSYISPTINMKFSPVSIVPGGISRLTVEVFNPNEEQLTQVDWANILNDPDLKIEFAENLDLVNTCGGTVDADRETNTLSLSNGIVPKKVGNEFGDCRVVVSVTSFTPGNHDNEILPEALTAVIEIDGEDDVELSNPTGAKETLNVASVQAPTVTKQFIEEEIWVGEQARLRISIQNRDSSTTLTRVSLTDHLPDGLVIGEPAIAQAPQNCGDLALITAVSGTDEVTITDARIAANQTCTFEVNVTGPEGIYENEIPAEAVQTFQRVTNSNPATAPLRVDGVRIQKAFAPTSFLAGEEQSTLTITI